MLAIAWAVKRIWSSEPEDQAVAHELVVAVTAEVRYVLDPDFRRRGGDGAAQQRQRERCRGPLGHRLSSRPYSGQM